MRALLEMLEHRDRYGDKRATEFVDFGKNLEKIQAQLRRADKAKSKGKAFDTAMRQVAYLFNAGMTHLKRIHSPGTESYKKDYVDIYDDARQAYEGKTPYSPGFVSDIAKPGTVAYRLDRLKSKMYSELYYVPRYEVNWGRHSASANLERINDAEGGMFDQRGKGGRGRT